MDLKAVNPNAVIKLDPRSPEELIASIREQGNVMGAALIRLEELVRDDVFRDRIDSGEIWAFVSVEARAWTALRL